MRRATERANESEGERSGTRAEGRRAALFHRRGVGGRPCHGGRQNEFGDEQVGEAIVRDDRRRAASTRRGEEEENVENEANVRGGVDGPRGAELRERTAQRGDALAAHEVARRAHLMPRRGQLLAAALRCGKRERSVLALLARA